MKSQTNLVRRGNVYQFRKKIPADIREDFNGRQSIRESLADFPSQAEAKREAGRRATLLDAEFASLRAAKLPRSAVPLTADLVPQLTMALHSHVLRADEEIREQGLSEQEFDFRPRSGGQRLRALDVPTRAATQLRFACSSRTGCWAWESRLTRSPSNTEPLPASSSRPA